MGGVRLSPVNFILITNMSKQGRIERIRSILDSYAIGADFAQEDVVSINLLTGWSFPYYKKVVNPRTPKETRCLGVSNDGVNYEVWSWRKAVSDIDNRTPAMRSAIQYQIDAFRKQWAPLCVHCGATNDLTVDHRYIPFVMIAKSFMDTEPNIEITNDNSGIGWVIKDPNILKAWQHFHEERANYQILCRSCNSAKGKKDDTEKRQA